MGKITEEENKVLFLKTDQVAIFHSVSEDRAFPGVKIMKLFLCHQCYGKIRYNV
jgi:hypothetical protein